MPKAPVFNVLHVDDDDSSRQSFQHALADFPELHYVQGFSDAESCNKFLEAYFDPCILFLDIELPGKNGLWLAQQLKHANVNIVFLTNHAEFADAAFEANALNFIIKPVTSARLTTVIETVRLQKMKIDSLFLEQVRDLYGQVAQQEVPKRIFISMVERIDVVPLENLVYLTSRSNNYSEFILKDGTRVVSSKTIKTYEEVLRRHPDFVRIHKSHIINKNFLRAVSRKLRNIKAIMTNGDDLEISYQRKDEIMTRLMD